MATPVPIPVILGPYTPVLPVWPVGYAYNQDQYCEIKFCCSLFYCHRQDTVKSKLFCYPQNQKKAATGCAMCKDRTICRTLNIEKKVIDVGFTLKKRLQNELLLFNEESTVNEIRIGRFLFKHQTKKE